MENTLPNVLDIALDRGLIVKEKTLNQKEVLFFCPWCGNDSLRRKRRMSYNLSLNPELNVFKCWACQISGGAIEFIARLDNRSIEDVRSEIISEWKKKSDDKEKKEKKKRPRHPVFRLSFNQVRLIGYDTGLRKRLYEFFEIDPRLARQKSDEIWGEWWLFLENERRDAFIRLLIGIKTGQYQKAIIEIEERSKNIGYDLLPDVFSLYGRHDPPRWTDYARQLVDKIAQVKDIKMFFDVLMTLAMIADEK